MNNWLKTLFTVLWFGCIVYLVIVAEEFSKDFKHEQSVKQEIIVSNNKFKTLYVDAENLNWKKHNHHINIDIAGIHYGKHIVLDTILNSNVSMNIVASKDSLMRLVIIKSAHGYTDEIASQRAGEIVYVPTQKDSLFILPHCFKKAKNQLWRNQSVDVELQIPLNKPVHLTQDALDLMNEKFFQPQYEDWDDDQIIAHNWVMTSNGLRLEK